MDSCLWNHSQAAGLSPLAFLNYSATNNFLFFIFLISFSSSGILLAFLDTLRFLTLLINLSPDPFLPGATYMHMVSFSFFLFSATFLPTAVGTWSLPTLSFFPKIE